MIETNIGTLPLGSIILGNQAEGTNPGPPVGVYGETSLIDGYRCKQGDTAITFEDTLTFSDASSADLTGCQVVLVVRNLADAQPLLLTGTGSVINATAGTVAYQPSASDTSIPSAYTACWIVTYPNGTVMTFPSIGYIQFDIEPALATETRLLVDLETIKRYPGMSIPANDRHLDSRLADFIQGIEPMIEQITGPIIPRTYVEKYNGGNNVISLSHRPSVGYGTSPILNVLACSEFIGPTEYPLDNVADVALGSIYSFEVNVRLGTITRRVSGGGTMAFAAGPNSVLVTYEAGQAEVPANVRLAVCEAVRMAWQTTQGTGRGRQTTADELETGNQVGTVLPPRVRQMLRPTGRGPAIA